MRVVNLGYFILTHEGNRRDLKGNCFYQDKVVIGFSMLLNFYDDNLLRIYMLLLN